ncbi:Kiwa anti-phage protein KwaB-like domain-containing protein [Phaeospirillum tilakii]|uniref:Kiwa anti-phage protein KwaB-like domain-containing protein n=1 Tax=Phaeospirillum tilakii TaxID=741673 RepID=A0ABW5CDS9_9PROT
MADLAGIKAFDLDGSDLTVWVYKKSMRDGLPIFTGRWVGITEDLGVALRHSVATALEAITEIIDYDILAQNNESSALTLGADETHIGLVEGQSANPTEGRKVTNLKHIANADFYMLRFANEDGVLLTLRKTNATWSTKRSLGMMRIVLNDEELDIDERPSFSIEPFFDFFVFGGDVFVSNKQHFESVLAYRAGHLEAFHELTADTAFSNVFSDVSVISDFVGENKIQLRRAIAIREKGHYRDRVFMKNLREECASMGFNIVFDEYGRIVPTPDSCRDIFQALLDHRLYSRLSSRIYDVQSTEPVG